jgi:hypothetical protein
MNSKKTYFSSLYSWRLNKEKNISEFERRRKMRAKEKNQLIDFKNNEKLLSL